IQHEVVVVDHVLWPRVTRCGGASGDDRQARHQAKICLRAELAVARRLDVEFEDRTSKELAPGRDPLAGAKHVGRKSLNSVADILGGRRFRHWYFPSRETRSRKYGATPAPIAILRLSGRR